MHYKNITTIARVTHEANRAWCEWNGDWSQPKWDDATAWQRLSAINGVQFHLEHPEAADSDSYENWMKQKLDEGWTYGEVKDPEKKTHPCLVPFDQLPLVQQKKDKLF